MKTLQGMRSKEEAVEWGIIDAARLGQTGAKQFLTLVERGGWG